VANGWVARDYLHLVAWQNLEHSVLLYAVIALLALTVLALFRQNRRLERLVKLSEGVAQTPSPPIAGQPGATSPLSEA
jgi:hypothetical protein